MVSYAYDTIQRGNPVGFFGMVLVLEGTSVALATRAANSIQTSLDLPRNAFSYLLSHGDLDIEIQLTKPNPQILYWFTMPFTTPMPA